MFRLIDGEWVFVLPGICSAEEGSGEGGGGVGEGEGEGSGAGGDGEGGGGDGEGGGGTSPNAEWEAMVGTFADPNVAKIAGRYLSPEEMAKGNLELRKKLSKAISIPGDDATDEELADYRAKIGVPKTVEEYGLTPPADLPDHLKPDDAAMERLGRFGEMLHANHVPKVMAEKMVEWFYGETVAQDEKAIEDHNAFVDAAEAEQRKKWGADYNANVALAHDAFHRFFGDNIGQLVMSNGQPLKEYPAFITAMAAIGKLTTEDGMRSASLTTDEQKATQTRIDEIHRIADTDEKKYWSKPIQEELAELYKKLPGASAPVVGSQGRTL